MQAVHRGRVEEPLGASGDAGELAAEHPARGQDVGEVRIARRRCLAPAALPLRAEALAAGQVLEQRPAGAPGAGQLGVDDAGPLDEVAGVVLRGREARAGKLVHGEGVVAGGAPRLCEQRVRIGRRGAARDG